MTEITYSRQGSYNLPNLLPPQEPEVALGKYALLRRKFLKENRRITYTNLLTSGKLNGHLAEIEQTAGERCQPIGQIGYYYPAEVWISEYGKLYAKYEYQDEIECFPDVFALIERELRQCKFDYAAMKTVEALDGKL